jgi:hypothetical protein
MGWACITIGGEECILSFNQKPEGKDHLKHLDIDGGILSNWIFKSRMGVDWIHLAPLRYHWWIVNAAKNLRIYNILAISLSK